MAENMNQSAPLEPSHRIDAIDPPWRARPLVMAAICAVAGVSFYHLVERDGADAFAAFVMVATIIFVLTVELRRLHWALIFALVWAGIIALIVENNRGYNQSGSPFEWPFWSGLLAIAIAAPLFQTWRDVAVDARAWRWWQLPYDRLHLHGWTDAVIGAASFAFVGISFALAWLIAGLFSLIGIDALQEVLQEGWFVLGLAGAAFGGAVGLLRERDRLVGTLQRLVTMVLAVLAPVLAGALALFLLALIGTGLQPLWRSGFSTAAMMLGASAFAVLLANAVIGNGREERASNVLLHWAAPVLVGAILPLAVIALYAMLMRIGQYGWTPERLWGMVAVVVAMAYGFAGLWSVIRGRLDFDDLLRPMQQYLAIGLMLLAAFLALPVLDFGAISTRDQLARLESGKVKPEKFDWAALAFDFGPEGRAALERLKKSPNQDIADAAKVAQETENRWNLEAGENAEPLRPIEKMVRVLPEGQTLSAEIYQAIAANGLCRRSKCVAYRTAPDRIAVIGRYNVDSGLELIWLAYDGKGQRWDQGNFGRAREVEVDKSDLDNAVITVEDQPMRQLVINGQPVGEPFAATK